MPDQTDLSAEEWAALEVLARQAKHTRDNLTPGATRDVDLMIRIRGSLTTGVSSSGQRSVVPKTDQILAHVLSMLPADAMTTAVEAFAEISRNGHALPDVQEGFVAMAQTMIAAASLSQPRRGQTVPARSLIRRRRAIQWTRNSIDLM